MASRSRRRRSALFCWFGNPALLVQTEAASTPELLRPGQGHPPACSGSADAHQIALLDPRWLPSATGSAGATTCWRRSASARRKFLCYHRTCWVLRQHRHGRRRLHEQSPMATTTHNLGPSAHGAALRHCAPGTAARQHRAKTRHCVDVHWHLLDPFGCLFSNLLNVYTTIRTGKRENIRLISRQSLTWQQ